MTGIKWKENHNCDLDSLSALCQSHWLYQRWVCS